MSKYISFHSDYFCHKEIFKSCKINEILSALDNTEIMSNISFSAGCLDVAREKTGVPFLVNCWYRDKEHNTRVKGSPTSDHMKGLAIDFHVSKSYRDHVITTIKHIFTTTPYLPVDQFIIYPTFFHLSFRKDNPRFQVIDKR